MRISLITFGIARDICGQQVLELEVPDNATAGYLRELLMETYPPLERLASFQLAVNQEFAEDDAPLSPQDEVALIPPVSGG